MSTIYTEHKIEFVSRETGLSTRMKATDHQATVQQLSRDSRCRTGEKALWAVWGRYLPFNNFAITDAGPRWEIPVRDGVWYVYIGHQC
ncbi:MAG: hypothetical protein KJ077_11175 [Anaerolineae bacterium]|nr:hypothetical protein [Anaerolineae bacterium]